MISMASYRKKQHYQEIRPSLAFIRSLEWKKKKNLSHFYLHSVPFYLSLSFLPYKYTKKQLALTLAIYYNPNFPWHLQQQQQQNLQKKKRSSFAPSEEEESRLLFFHFSVPFSATVSFFFPSLFRKYVKNH